MANGRIELVTISQHEPSERRLNQEHWVRLFFALFAVAAPIIYVRWNYNTTQHLMSLIEDRERISTNATALWLSLITSSTIVTVAVLLPILRGIYRSKSEQGNFVDVLGDIFEKFFWARKFLK